MANLNLPPDIIDFEVGLKVAVRSVDKVWYGAFTKLTKMTAEVCLNDGRYLKFMRTSRKQIGGTFSYIDHPYLTSVGCARVADAYYTARRAEALTYLQRVGGAMGGHT